MPSADERNAMQRKLRGSVNHKMPPFPCNVLLYSKDSNIKGFKLIRFSTQAAFDKFRNMTVAMVRVILVEEDLADVSDERLRFIYNQLAPEGQELDTTEIPRNELHGLVFGVIHDPDAATLYEESDMTAATAPETGTPDTAESKTKAEARALEQKQKRELKEKEKADKKASAAAKRADGVIGTIKKALDTAEGTTANEVLDTLVKKFPDRTREGMSSTVKIQFSRLEKSTKRDIINAKIKGRGRVYKFADKGAVQGEIETETPAQTPAPVDATTTAPVPAAETAPAIPAVPAKSAGKGGNKK